MKLGRVRVFVSSCLAVQKVYFWYMGLRVITALSDGVRL